MTQEFASQVYIPRRMRELGFGDNYFIRFKHFVMQPGETKEVDADNEYFFLVDRPDNVGIQSSFGIFDLSFDKTDEQSYEHTGKIEIVNYASTLNHLQFIQAIPRFPSTKPCMCNNKNEN